MYIGDLERHHVMRDATKEERTRNGADDRFVDGHRLPSQQFIVFNCLI